jgi:hypothetical protein
MIPSIIIYGLVPSPLRQIEKVLRLLSLKTNSASGPLTLPRFLSVMEDVEKRFEIKYKFRQAGITATTWDREKAGVQVTKWKEGANEFRKPEMLLC